MSVKMKYATVLTLAAVAVHAYLAIHHYQLNYGLDAGQAVCNVNAKFNCDAVSASQYSSFLSIPLAVWGLITNLIFFILVFGYSFGLSDHLGRLARVNLLMASGILGASVIMGSISLLLMDVFCLFCMAAYVLSILTFELIRREQKSTEEGFFENLGADFKAFLGEAKSIGITLAVIPLLAFFTHQIFLTNFSGQRLEKSIKAFVKDWQSSSPVSFTTQATLVRTSGSGTPEITIVEFADFLCGHCKKAAPNLKAFVSSNPNVEYKFYVFPLDGSCNEAISRNVGVPCRLAKSVYCANKQDFGWELHDHIFENQSQMASMGTVSNVDGELKKYTEKQNKNWDSLVECMDSEETHSSILAQAKAGKQANVEGTPTIFVNNKKLPNGQFIPVLNAVRKEIK